MASTLRYESFKDEIYDDGNGYEISGGSETMVSDTGQLENGGLSDAKLANISTIISSSPQQSKRVRLRAVESEREYFLKLMNVDLFRKFVVVQAVSSLVIIISQVVMYADVTWYTHKTIDSVGIGLWAPLLFFFQACWLTWMTTRSPSGCSIGTAMGFQIFSIFVGIILIVFATIGLAEVGHWKYPEKEYEHEMVGRVFCSFMLLAGVCQTVISLFTSIQYCKVTCCSLANAHKAVLFDVEIVKV